MARRTAHAIASTLAALGLIAAPVASASQAAKNEHVVQPGETLSQIALDAGVDAPTLLRLNELEDGNLLIAGQTLKLPVAAAAAAAAPAPARSSATYTVVDGDTLSGIALQLNVSASALIDTNQLQDPDRLRAGVELLVPGAAAPAAPASAVPAAAPKPAAPAGKRSIVTSYTVQPGETLSHIARQLDVRADAIAQASGLDDPNRISVGTVLKVPLPGYEHVVKEGETLRDIALRTKVDLGSLIDFNALDDPELIRVGQVLIIPAPATQRAASIAPQSAATPAPKPATPAPVAKPAPAPAPAPANAPKEGIVGSAMKLLGAPYVWGGSSPSGFDCSGFVWYVVRQSGKSIARGLMGEYNSGSHPARNELKAGDLVFFQNTYTPGLSHNGIFIGNDQFIHAADEQSGVTISSLSSSYWSSHWFGATRLP